MPTSAPTACSTAGCAAYSAYRGKCKTCNTSQDAARGTATERGYDAAWRRLRSVVLMQEPLCRECSKRGTYIPATDVDHIVPNATEPHRRLDSSNLQPLCKRCHSRKTAMESSGWSQRVGWV